MLGHPTGLGAEEVQVSVGQLEVGEAGGSWGCMDPGSRGLGGGWAPAQDTPTDILFGPCPCPICLSCPRSPLGVLELQTEPDEVGGGSAIQHIPEGGWCLGQDPSDSQEQVLDPQQRESHCYGAQAQGPLALGGGTRQV